MKIALKYLLVLIFPTFLFAQNKTDSLNALTVRMPDDTNKVNILLDIVRAYQSTDPDSALKYSLASLDVALRTGWTEGIARTEHAVGFAYYYNSKNNEALKHFFISEDTWERLIKEEPQKRNKYRLELALTSGGIGNVYYVQANYPQALSYHFKALKIAEELQDKRGIMRHSSNIGIVYREQGKYSEAINYHNKALEAATSLKNEHLIASVLTNLGTAYSDKGNNDLALECYTKALRIFEAERNDKGACVLLENMGSVFFERKDYKQAEIYYQRAIKLAEVSADQYSVATILGSIGMLYIATKKYDKAEPYLKRGLTISDSIGDLETQKDINQYYVKMDSARGNFAGALQHYKKYIVMRDSISNDENTKKQTRLEMQYEFDKKEQMAKAEQERKDEIAAADKKRHSIVLWSISGCGLLVLIFAVFAWRSFLQKKKTNEEITHQKKLIEEKQKEILDSIYYARRIQRSLLPNEKMIEKYIRRLQ